MLPQPRGKLSMDVLGQIADGVLDGHRQVALDVESSDWPVSDTGDDREYSADIQRLAFQIWAFDVGEDISAAVVAIHDRLGVAIHPERLRRWRQEQHWVALADEVGRILEARAPAVARRLITVGTVKAARWAVEALDNPAVKYGTRLQIAKAMWDRGGLPATVQGQFAIGHYDARGGELAGWDDDDLSLVVDSFRLDESGEE